MKLRFACATVLLSAGIAASAAAQDKPALALGLIRPDGILLPVAVREAGAWVDPWPAPTDGMRLDRPIESTPSYWLTRRQQVPQLWQAVASPARPRVAANVLSHVIYSEHCVHQAGLLTDLQRAGKDQRRALAIDGTVHVAQPVRIDAASAQWRDLITRALEEVPRQEQAAVVEYERETGRESQLEPAASRRPITLRRLYAHRAGSVRTLYYEAERTYQRSISSMPGTEPSVLAASGWIHAPDGATPAVPLARAVITDPDYKEGLTTMPLAILTIEGAAVWAVLEHGYESEEFALIEVTRGGISRAFQKFVGGC